MEGSMFSVVNLVAVAGWVLLAVFPRRRLAAIVAGRVVPALLSGAYVAVVLSVWGQSPGGFSSLAAVGQLFDNRWMLLAGWIHYLAFDLVIGSWMVQDAREHGIPHGLLVPLLLLTFMFGPAGWLAYLGLRAALSSRWRGLAATSELHSGHAAS